MQAITLALPMSSAATRSTSSPGSSVSSIAGRLSVIGVLRSGRPRESRGSGDGLACSQRQCVAPKRLPASDCKTASTTYQVPATSAGSHTKFSRPQGVAAGDTADCNFNLTVPLDRLTDDPAAVPSRWDREGTPSTATSP